MTEKKEENKINPLVLSLLILTIIFYLASTIFFFIFGDILINFYNIDPKTETLNLYAILSILSFINFIFSFVLLGKSKIGFWGLVFTSLIGSYYIYRISFWYSLIPIIIVALIYTFLQIKYNEKTAWQILK